jgi:Skp family chaperone for outer membrane proteins
VKKFIVVIIVAVLLVGVNAYAADKVGFINVSKLLSDSVIGKKASAEIEKMGVFENVVIKKENKEQRVQYYIERA